VSELVQAEIWTVAKTDQGNAVLVRPINGDRAVPIFIGPLEAQNILLGLGEVEIPRPLTHDLLLHLLTHLEAELVRVDIHSFSEGTYYSNLVLRHRGELIEIDSRPSDSLALAVRCGCPISIASDLVEESGVSLEQLKQSVAESDLDDDEDEPEADADLRQAELENLRSRLEKAVGQELYEEAARLRDEIHRLENE